MKVHILQPSRAGCTAEISRLLEHIIHGQGVQRLIQLSCSVVPGLGPKVFSVKQATRDGVVSNFDMDNRRLEAKRFTALLQEPKSNLYAVSLELINGSGASGLAVEAVDHRDAMTLTWYVFSGT